jgi:hypothetical protein
VRTAAKKIEYKDMQVDHIILQRMLRVHNFIGSKNEINDEDFKYIVSAKRQLEKLLENLSV